MLRPLLVCLLATACVHNYAGPIIDTHAHLRLSDKDGLSPEHPKGTRELRALETQAGVTHASLIVIAQKGKIEETRAKNDAVIAAAKESGGFFYPIVSVHPDDGADAFAELARVAALGVRVIKLHPNTQSFDVAADSVAALADKAGALGLILLFDGFKPWDANESGKYLLLAVTHPHCKFILAHLGDTRFDEMAMFGAVRKFAWYANNVWFDISAVATLYADSPYRDQLAWVIRTVGTDRVLFGSDWPVDAPADAARAVRKLGFTESEQRQIFFGNAAALLGLQ